MCQGSEYGTVVYARVTKSLNIGQYASIMPEYVSMCLNILEYA